MKFTLFAIAATLALVNAADCDLSKVRPLLTNPDVATCTTESGFSFVPPSKPTAEIGAKVCASTACKNVLTAVKALGLGDCTLLGLQLETDLLTPLSTACGSSSASATASNSTSSGAKTSGSQAGNATVTAPKASTNGSSASNSTTDAAKSAAATPTPAPTSSASSIAIASSAAVVAVAAAFL